MSAMGTVTGISTPGSAPWTSPSRNYAPDPSSQTGCLSDAPGLQRALTTVIATCYLKGVSTRRMNDLVATLGINNLSKSQASDMAKDLDVMVEDFRTRPLDTGPYLYVSCDALTSEKSVKVAGW